MSTSRSRSKQFLNNKRILSKDSKNNLQNKNSHIILNKGPWTEKEDQLLIKWVEKYGACNWTKCSDFIKGRSGKQCREHWNNSLDPNLTKGQWTSEEDLLIMIFYKKYDGSWKRIIPIFEKRTENSIKNRFFSQLRKLATKYIQTKKREYSTKFGLEDLKKFLNEATALAKKKYFSENKMNEKEFEEYINRIDKSVKNRKKGNKFINLDNIRNNKNINNNVIDINEDNEYNEDNEENNSTYNNNNYEKEENIEIKKKGKRGRKKKAEQLINNKEKEEKFLNIDEENIRGGSFTNEETINPIQIKSNEEEIGGNNNNNNTLTKKRSKKFILTNEKENEKEKKLKNDNDNFLPPLDMNNNKNNFNNNNTIENNNISNYFKNAKKNNYNNYNEYTINKNINNDDLDSKDSMEEINKSIGHKNSKYFLRKNTKTIENEIKKGIDINPFVSFDINEDKNTNYESKNTYNNISKKNSFRNNSKEIKFKNSNNIPFGFHCLRSRTISYLL